MRTLQRILLVTMLSVGAFISPVVAAPGDGLEQPRLEILDSVPASCPGHGELCLASGAPATRALVTEHGGDGMPRFTRTTASLDDETPWTIEVTAALRPRALSGNALFIVYDAEDPKALAEREVTALWQAPIRAGKSVAARLVLSPEDGFHAGHTYRISVAQILNGRQVIMATGELRLL